MIERNHFRITLTFHELSEMNRNNNFLAGTILQQRILLLKVIEKMKAGGIFTAFLLLPSAFC